MQQLSLIQIINQTLPIMDKFGKQRLADFQVDPNYINVNHGSYGYCPRVVIQQQRKLKSQCEFNTQKWFRYDAQKLLNQTRSFLASKLNCPLKNLYFVQNASDAISSLLKSLNWSEGDIILLPSISYQTNRMNVNYLRDRYNITVLYLPIKLEHLQSQQAFQMQVEDFVNSYPKKIKLAIFDHISSIPSFICPIDSLVQFFKEKNIPLFIDGAHAINQVNLNMGDLQPDAYFSNFHKWGFSPKGATFLYLSDKYIKIIRPVVTAYHYGDGPEWEFFWTGTRDQTPYICVKKAIQYSQSFGMNAVKNYNHNLAKIGAERVAEIWGTRLLTSDQRCFGSLISVEVPTSTIDLCNQISEEMLYQVNCYPLFFEWEGTTYIRLSAQIYNQLSDYQYVALTFLIYLEKHHNKMTKQVGSKQNM